MRRWLFFLLIVLSLIGYHFLIDIMTDGFSPSYIRTKYEEIHLTHASDISSSLNQKFYYIQKGSQSFVFIGEDQATILKFFRCNRYHTIFSFLFPKKQAEKKAKWDALMTSCVIAHNELKEESALLYVNLEKSSHLPKVTVVDKLGRSFVINLNETFFILQKKGNLFRSFLLECKNNQTLEIAKNAVSNIVKLIQLRQNKGINDADPALAKNIGIFENTPFFLDIGEFHKGNPKRIEEQKSEVRRIAAKLDLWVLENYPDLYPFFEEITYGSSPLCECHFNASES